MKKVITTKAFTCRIEVERNSKNSSNTRYNKGVWRQNFWEIKQSSLDKAMKQLTDLCNQGQYEVQAIMPLTNAEAYEYAQADSHTWSDGGYGWGIGQGWGVTMTNGFVALLQRIEEFTEEEYVQYQAQKNALEQERQQLFQEYQQFGAELRKYSKQLEQVDAQMKSTATQYEQINARIAKGIDEHNIGLLKSKIVYRYGEQQCANRAEAEQLLGRDRAQVNQLSHQYQGAKAAREQPHSEHNKYYNMQKAHYDRIKQITIELGDDFSFNAK